MAEQQTIDIRDLQQDAHNFNRGTDAGRTLMEKSFRELGAGRSVLIDKNGQIIAGNKSQQAAIAAGITRVRVIETDGTELVAVKRTDIDLDSQKGRELALADNATTQVNLAWDEAELQAAADEYGLDLDGWGVETPEWQQAEQETAEAADARDDADDKKERQRDPDSEIIVATVSLFGTTYFRD